MLRVLPLLALASCGLVDGGSDARAAARQVEVQPYPAAERTGYDEVGYASWYGSELAGHKTGNGETFDPQAITGAHRTLPLPSFVEVTNLDTGRTILVRINDRGPFSKARIVDLSLGAARLLGVAGQGSFPVRVRRVNPPEYERTALQSGAAAAERLQTPPALLRALRRRLSPATAALADVQGAEPVEKAVPGSAAKPAPPAGRGHIFIQIGAFSTRARAATAARQVGGSIQAAGKFWRVRTGPYVSEAAAKAALGPVAAKGYRDARIIR